MNKTKIILIIAAIVILLTIGISIFVYVFSPAHDVAEALIDNDINKATDVFSKVKGIFIHEKIYSFLLPNALNEINENYNADSISYEDVFIIYETVNSFSSKNGIEENYSDFIELYESKIAFNTAQEALSKRNYPEAILNFKKVIEKDQLYYTAQDKINYYTELYVKQIKDSFYSEILASNYTSASEIIDKAIQVINDESLYKMKESLSNNIYEKCIILLDNIEEWQIIDEAHAGESTYCCYEISISEQNKKYFACHYVVKSLNTQVQNGGFGAIGGPFVWYKINKNNVVNMTYDEDKNLTEGYSVSWDYTSSKLKKLEQLEKLFS